jgi:heme exporter protein C
MPGEMWLTFILSMAGMALLWVTLVKFELTAKNASAQLSRLRRALERPEPAGGAARPTAAVATRPD